MATSLQKKKKPRNNRVIYMAVGIIGVLVVLLIFGKKQGWIGGKDAKKVAMAKAQKATIVDKVSAAGKVQPVEEVKLSSQVPGEVLELFVEEGDSVKKGQLLLKIKPDNQRSALERAIANLNTQKANLAQSKARLAQQEAQTAATELNYNRIKGLYDQKAVSSQEFENAKRDLDMAKANTIAAKETIKASEYTVLSAEASVSEARENLSFTEIFAPIGGTITSLSVEKGEKVVGTQQMAGTELMRIANLNQMEVRVNVNENDIIRISKNDTVIIDVDSYSAKREKFKGLVYSIANSAKQTSGSLTDAVTEFEVRIRLINSSYAHLISPELPFPFRPGMTASVEIITETKANVLTVPLSAVTTRTGNEKKDEGFGPPNEDEGAEEKEDKKQQKGPAKEAVFVNKNGTAVLVFVKTGISDFENIEITEGINEGDEVVSGPFLMVSKTLSDGDLIQPAEEKTKGVGPGGE